MNYMHQRTEWPQFHWNSERLMPLVARVRHQQGLLLGGMQTLGFRIQQQNVLENLTAEVIKSSAIEGTTFDAASVRSSIARRLGLPTESRAASGRDVEGAVEMMIDATAKFDQPLTVDRLLGWQAALFPSGRSGLQRIAVGQWRTPAMDPMQVVSGPVSRDRIRRKHIHFEAPAAELIPQEIETFLQWFEKKEDTDPVLRAGLAHLWFVTIHPFEDGNGRVARAIADMALARSEGSSRRFYSMSAQIEQEKQAYYDALETAQKGTLEITTWLEWFLGCFGRALTGASKTLEQVMAKTAHWEQINGQFEPNERQRKVLNALLDAAESELSTSKYAKIADTSLDTALRDIRQMVGVGILALTESGGRSTKYRLLRRLD